MLQSRAATVALLRAAELLPGSFLWSPCLDHLPTAAAACQQHRGATKKAGGSSNNRGGAQPKYLGVKLSGSQACRAGNIIVRQRGTEFHPSANVGMGTDHTLYALIDGQVRFLYDKHKKRRSVAVLPLPPPAVRPNLSQ